MFANLWISISLLLLIYSPLIVTGQCPLPTVDDIEGNLDPLLDIADGQANYNPNVSSYRFTCLAQGSTRDTYRRVSIIATFTPNSGESSQTQHFQLECSSDTWSAITNHGFEPPPSNSMLRRDCLTCVPQNLGGDPNHCSECSAMCRNMGQGSCVTSATDCCPFFDLNNMCTTSCPTNYIANVDTNFTCVCNYTCGPGEVVNATCNGCNLTDICLRDMPCQNGGSCILLSAPDNYTCNCSGTGYMGINCNDSIPSSTTTSPSPTPSSSSTPSPSPTPSQTPTPSPCPSGCDDCNNTGCCITCGSMYSLSGCSCGLLPVPTSSTPTPSQSPDQGGRGGDGIGTGGLVGIIIGILLGILLLLALAAVIAYVIYYFVAGAGAAGLNKANANSLFPNGDAHDNPLYVDPDEASKL